MTNTATALEKLRTFHDKREELVDLGVPDRVIELRNFLEKTVKGQPKAINAVCKLYQYELALRWLEERKGPVGVLMFLGPSGVGKTELARMLARHFMGSVDSLVKIDCAGFSQPHAIHSLIGAPHGYVGYNDQPLFSQQNLLKRIKKIETAPKNKNLVLFNNQKRVLNDKISVLNSIMAGLEEDLRVKTNMATALASYHSVLHGDNGDSDSQPVSQLLADSETKQAILALVRKDVRNTLKQDLANSIEDAGMLLELQVTIKHIIKAHQESEIEAASLSAKLREVNERISELEQKEEEHRRESLKDNRADSRLIILFDEIEKANSSLHQLLLQVMEEGRLTLANGQITDIRNSFVILTSNVGSGAIGDILKSKRIGFGRSFKSVGRVYDESVFDEVEKSILTVAEREMGKTFRPEFRRRIDEVVVFRPLSEKTFHEILDYHIELFSQSLNVIGVDLAVDQKVRDIIVEHSLHRPEVGASLLDHKFKTLVKIPLGQRLFAEETKRTIVVYADASGKIKFALGD